MKYQLQVELEFIRKQIVRAEVDTDVDGYNPPYMPTGVGQLHRNIEYAKNIYKKDGENVKVIRWQINPLTCQYENCTKETGGRSYCENHYDIP